MAHHPKFKVAIVGLGRAARNIHLPALRKIPGVEVVGGYDSDGGGGGVGVRAFESLDAMLATQPDMLIVATPPSSHVQLTQRGLLSGAHVFCEKPLAETLPSAEEIFLLARQCGRQVVVNSEFPFMPIHAAARRRMAEPGFGQLMFASMHQTFRVTDDTEAGWRGLDPERTLKEFGTHVIDLAKFFFQERPRSIRARLPRPDRGKGQGGPDFLALMELEFSGDRFAHIMLDRLTRGRHRYLDIRLDGTEATIETSIGGRLRATAGLRTSPPRPYLDLDIAMGGRARLYRGESYEVLATAPLDLFADATARLLQAAIPKIVAGETPPCGLEEARNTLRLLLSCYAAAPGDLTRCDDW
jgi:predicted dehydrogenase